VLAELLVFQFHSCNHNSMFAPPPPPLLHLRQLARPPTSGLGGLLGAEQPASSLAGHAEAQAEPDWRRRLVGGFARREHKGDWLQLWPETLAPRERERERERRLRVWMLGRQLVSLLVAKPAHRPPWPVCCWLGWLVAGSRGPAGERRSAR